MPDGYFLAWAAVKNGLYKAALVPDRAALVAQLEKLLAVLLERERVYDGYYSALNKQCAGG